jgi:hypothetical protein
MPSDGAVPRAGGIKDAAGVDGVRGARGVDGVDGADGEDGVESAGGTDGIPGVGGFDAFLGVFTEEGRGREEAGSGFMRSSTLDVESHGNFTTGLRGAPEAGGLAPLA